MTGTDTLFAKIVRREIPAEIVFESEKILAFKDINPQAPLHILIIPKKIIPHVGACLSSDQDLLGEMLLVAGDMARKSGVEKDGYRLVINTGNNGGQTVPHLHVHLLGGRKLEWPPG